jgi:hypothetical protein
MCYDIGEGDTARSMKYVFTQRHLLEHVGPQLRRAVSKLDRKAHVAAQAWARLLSSRPLMLDRPTASAAIV